MKFNPSWRKERTLTATDIDAASENAKHPISSEIVVLRRFVHYLGDEQKLSECAFRRYGYFLTDDDPQVFAYLCAAIKRGCLDVTFRPGAQRLAKIMEYLRDPKNGHSKVIWLWNQVVQQGLSSHAGLEPDYDPDFLREVAPRLRAALG